MRKHTINVTLDDIAQGSLCEASCCPIALAMQREFPNVACSVYHDFLFAGELIAVTPPAVREWLWDYDSEDTPMQPFTFTATFD